jgi:hypothetical protein
MGALDDAIREHLELKRRHGASEDEIRQAESEALGPARRPPGSGVGDLPGETELDEAGMPAPVEAFEPPPDPGSAVHDAPPPPLPDDAVAEAPLVPPPGIEPEPLVASQPLEPVEPAPFETEPVEPEPVEPAPLHGAVATDDEPPAEPPEVEPDAYVPPDPAPEDQERARTAILDDPLHDPPPVHHEPGPDEPPAPARPPEAAAPAPGDEDEDVLEETPDFLSETPEHDRLWFEQKPPRDFDFD